MIKIGDKVRIIRNSVNGNHPVENRLLIAGDVVTVYGIENNYFYYQCNSSFSRFNSMYISDVVKEEFTFIISRNKL